MQNTSLAEMIKKYVYTKQKLDADPDSVSIRLELADICLNVGLFRTAAVMADRVLEQEPEMDRALQLAKSAHDAVSASDNRDCRIAVGRTGHILVLDSIMNRLTKWTARGERIWVYEREGFEDNALYRPGVLAVDPLGNVYVGSHLLSRVQVFNSNGIFQRVFPVPKKFGGTVIISSLACDEAGNLWLMDSASKSLRLLDPEGNELQVINL